MSGWRLSARVRLGRFDLAVDLQGGGGVTALVGPNGSGKSTLLRLLTGALSPTEGELSVGEEALFSSARGIDVPMEQRRVGYLPQGYGLFPHLSVLDNVAFGLSTGPRRLPEGARHDAAKALLAQLGCEHLAARRPTTLSGGEQQRVALARALLVRPRLLLLDEPLSALDATARRAVRRVLAEQLRAAGCPSVVVTHDVRDVAALDATFCVLERGRVTQWGPLEALRAAPASDFVAELVGADPPAASPR